MNAKEFRNVLLFMCNRWNESECSMIFNGFGCANHHGSLDCIAAFILELDNECLQKLINRTQEYYK